MYDSLKEILDNQIKLNNIDLSKVKTIKLGWLGQYQRFAELDYR